MQQASKHCYFHHQQELFNGYGRMGIKYELNAFLLSGVWFSHLVKNNILNEIVVNLNERENLVEKNSRVGMLS